MSKISLAPDASGSAIFTIASPGTSTNRTLTLPDDTGTLVTSSGNQAGSFTTLNTSGAVVFNDAGADVDFRVEGDTDANLLFVDASADAVGIGTSSSTNKATIQVSNTSTSPNSESGLSIFNSARGNNYQATVKFGSYESNNTTRWTAGEIGAAFTAYTDGANSGALLFSTSNAGTLAERMRIDSSGNLLVGTTSQIGSGTHCVLAPSGKNAVVARVSAADNLYVGFDSAGSVTFLVASDGDVTNTNNSYGAISDVKLKQDIVDAGSQWGDLKAVRIRKFRFKNDPDGVLQIGVIAQELEEVSPGLVSEHPDYEMVDVPVLDDEGNPVLDEEGNPTTRQERQATGETTKSVKATVLYMKAVKALQEAMERIETLEAKVATLENNNG